MSMYFFNSVTVVGVDSLVLFEYWAIPTDAFLDIPEEIFIHVPVLLVEFTIIDLFALKRTDEFKDVFIE